MSLFENCLGVNREHNFDMKSLAASKVDEKLDTGTTGVSIDDSEKPTMLEEFDNAYRKESQVFQSINSKVQIIMKSGHELRADNDDDGEVLKFFNELLDSLGDVGEESTWEEMLESIFFSNMKYGKHFIELMYNKRHTKVLDLMTHDSKKMDFARDITGNILLDVYSKPIGYTRQFPVSADIEGKGDKAPEEVDLKQGVIFLEPKRIAYFWLYGDALDPIGLIEPAYKSVVYKQNIQEAQSNSIYQRGLFPIIDYVGSPERFPTPKMINNATNKLKMMQHNRYFAFPFWHNIKPLEVKQSDVVENTVKSLKEEIAASLGMPLVLSTGSGEATNKSTLKIQTHFLEDSLYDVVKRVLSSIRKQIFKRISQLNNFKDKNGKLIVPYIVWGEIGVDSKDDKIDRLAKMLKSGGVTPDYVIPYVIKSEGLVKDDTIETSVDAGGAAEPQENKEGSTKELAKSKNSNFSYSDVEKIIRNL